MNVPFSYTDINLRNGTISPSTCHVKNTALREFFSRYLMQKAMSVFKWDIPKEWAKNYFLYVLFNWGFISVINTERFGVIPQQCGLGGYNVFYQPSTAIISNPLIPGINSLEIGRDCEIIRLTPDWGGIGDLVGYYADQLALAGEAASVNMMNSKLAYVFAANNKAAAESFKKLYDQISSGEPAAFYDTKLQRADGRQAWETFTQNVGQNYIVSDILNNMRELENQFCTEIGVPNANTTKRERMITDEVNANNTETYSRAAMWLEQLQEDCERVNAMFPGININVDWRFENGESVSNDNGIVSGEQGSIRQADSSGSD